MARGVHQDRSQRSPPRGAGGSSAIQSQVPPPSKFDIDNARGGQHDLWGGNQSRGGQAPFHGGKRHGVEEDFVGKDVVQRISEAEISSRIDPMADELKAEEVYHVGKQVIQAEQEEVNRVLPTE